MNKESFTFHLNPTPTLPTRGCRMIARLLAVSLSYGNYLIALGIWWISDWFIAIGTLLLGFLVFGILRSKLRNDSIPPAQREYPYDDYAIASWYLSRNHCFTIPSANPLTASTPSEKSCCTTSGECETCEDDGSGCSTCADRK